MDIEVESMDNPAIETLSKWAKRRAEEAEHDEYIQRGRQQAYRDVVDHMNQTCMECGEYFYSLDRLAEHQADKHPQVEEVSMSNTFPNVH